MRRIALTVILGLVVLSTTPVMGTPLDWYARGEFNGWGLADQLVDLGGGHYDGTISGLTQGDRFGYKIAREDWSATAPGSNGRVIADANGEINFHFWESTSWGDGWEPSTGMRVGYSDPGQFGWEIIGDMNSWNIGADMTDQGNGLYSVQIPLTTGSYSWKFREDNSWNISIGDDFGNSAFDNVVVVMSNGDWLFELDLPNGRWDASAVVPANVPAVVPEPTPLALIALGLVGLGLSRRKHKLSA
ncbi:MAG: hypothetical protein BMS9Abin08_0635 [Gammaproteobacteria bacterium]|nr:MAG: hypothetical protein BMS9Abin08_0635 [Gammaproteobacteria bacterium]